MLYNNYHKHTHKSNIFSPDTHIDIEAYMERMKELGHNTYFTTEHGFGGDVFEARKYCDNYKYKCVFAIEAYCVVDSQTKDSSNYHIMIIAKTNNARRKINLLNSNANEFGFYYKPRWSLEDILSLPKGEVYITSACVGGIAKNNESIDTLLSPIARHFGDDFFLEINHNNNQVQKEHNTKLLVLSQKMRLNLIHANDSHYIYPEQHKERAEMLKGKKISYGDEDAYILDYPTYDYILESYEEQGVVSEELAKSALANTLILDRCEGIDINYEVKMPSIHLGMNIDDKHAILKQKLNESFKATKLAEGINDKAEVKKRIEGIKFEYDIVEKTKEVSTVDYFLLNERVVDLAVNKYNGFLSPTARGSGVSFYINKLLGFTEIDRFDAPIPLYPTRFMSVTRILESRSMPDFDFNTTDPEPFIKATKELLGEHGCYPMIAYGTMKDSEAFRNTCRAMGMSFDEFNHVGKDIDSYREDEKWGKIIKASEVYGKTVINMSIHPCAVLLMNDDIREEIGIVKTAKGMVCVIDSKESDDWKYLKNDYLTVSVWKIITEVCKSIGIDVPTVMELNKQDLTPSWKLYENGITSTLNQVDGSWATDLVKKYNPTNIAELSAFVAAIRPGFASLLNHFISRVPYTTGVKALDDVLGDSYHYMLYQESIMKCLVWLSINEDSTYGIIKKIAKKVFKEEELEKLQKQLKDNWIKEVGSIAGFKANWQVIEDSSRYAFNAAHACAYAYDSLYCAYLKSTYPMHYYSTVLNLESANLNKTDALEREFGYFDLKLSPITFRQSRSHYTFDKDSRTIYKGLKAIKHVSETVADELYELRDVEYRDFAEVLVGISQNTSINARQIEILIKLDYFREFGEMGYLLRIYEIFTWLWNKPKKDFKQQFKKSKVSELKLPHETFVAYSRQTAMTYMDLSPMNIMKELSAGKHNKATTAERIQYQQEYLGHISIKTGLENDKTKICILEVRGNNKKKWLKGYNIYDGTVEEYRIYQRILGKHVAGDIVEIIDLKQAPKIHYRGLDEEGKPIYEHDPIKREWLLERIIGTV